MAFIPPVPLIRKNRIINRLRQSGAISEATAKTLTAAGIINPNAFAHITEKLVRDKLVGRTTDGSYYLL